MKNLLKIALQATTLGISLIAHAESGSGTRGGGQIVDVDTNPVLADLVTKAVCDEVIAGEDLVKAHPAFENQIITPLRALDWYFADSILNEARHLKFCMTGPLYTILPADYGVPVVQIDQTNVKQIAYRFGNTVYMDEALWNLPNMSETTRGYVLLHEAIHSFFPMDIDGRQLKLRTMVKAISKVVSGEITSQGDLHKKMTENDVDFPLTVSSLDAYRAQIEFLLEPEDFQVKDLRALKEIDSILDLPKTAIDLLAPRDHFFLRSSGIFQIVSQAYLTLMKQSTPADFQSLLADAKFKRLERYAALFWEHDQLTAQQQAILDSPESVKGLYQDWFGDLLNDQSITKGDDGRAIISQDTLAVLGMQSSQPYPVLDLPKAKSPLDYYSVSRFAGLIKVLADLMHSGKTTVIQTIAGPASPFADLIGLAHIQSELAAFDFADFKIEKRLCPRRIVIYTKSLKDAITDDLRSRLTPDEYTKFLTLVPVLNTTKN